MEAKLKGASGPQRSLAAMPAASTDVRADPSYTTPLPRMQVFLIASTNFINATCYLVTFPLVPFLVLHWYPHLTEKEAGYYSGTLEGTFHAGQFFGAFAWAIIADKCGRKSALQWGLLGTAVSTIAFGLSPSFAFAVAVKFIWGLLNGNVGVAKTMLSELTDDTNSAKAFSYIGVATGAGRIVGPIIGGFLAQPAIKYPALFSADGFFGQFPFVLPCLIVAAITMLAFLLGSVYMIETRPAASMARRSVATTTPARSSTGAGETKGESERGKLREVELAEKNNKTAGKAEEPRHDDVDDDDEEEGSVDEEEVSLMAAATSPVRSKKSATGNIDLDEDEEENEERAIVPVKSEASEHSAPEDDADAAKQKASREKAPARKSKKLQRLESEEELDLDMPLPSTRSGSSRRAASWLAPVARYCSQISRVLRDPAVKSTTGLYTSLAAIGLAATELFPLYLVTPVASGGFDWGSQEVGILVAICGPFLMVFQAFVYPALAKKLGLVRLLRLALGVHALAMAVVPACSFLTRLRSPEASSGEVGALEMTAMGATLVVSTLSRISSFSTMFVLIANSSKPDDRSLVNGLGQATASLVRFIFPPLATSLYAWSITSGNGWPFDYSLAWYCMAAATLVCMLISYALPSWIEKKRPQGV